MDYINSLLVLQDDLNEDLGEPFTDESQATSASTSQAYNPEPTQQNGSEAQESEISGVPDWCVCGRC